MVVDSPLQISASVADAEIEGSAFTFTVTVATFVQPPLVPVTVYVVVAEGLTEYDALEPSE